MGIKGLGAWMRKNTPETIHTVSLELFSGERLAVDASIYLYKYICISNSGSGNYFDMFLNMILWLRSFNIRPVFVFDGKPPPQKDRTKQKRKENKEKLKNQLDELEYLLQKLDELDYTEPLDDDLELRVLSIYSGDKLDPRRKIIKDLTEKYKKVSSQCIQFTKEDIDKIKDLLDCLGLPWVQSDYEAEKTCSWLVKHGYVKAVVTADSDVLAYGTEIWLSDIRSGDQNCKIIRYPDVLASSGFTSQQFTDFCIMCGTDYNENIPGIGPAKAYKLLQEYEKLENIEQLNYDTDILYYKDARNLFTLPDDIPDFEIESINQPNWGALELLLFKCNSRIKIDKIRDKIYKPEFKIIE